MIAIGSTPDFAASALTGTVPAATASRAFADELASALLLLRADGVHVSQGIRDASNGNKAAAINSCVRTDSVLVGLVPWILLRRIARTRAFSRAGRERRRNGRNHRETSDD